MRTPHTIRRCSVGSGSAEVFQELDMGTPVMLRQVELTSCISAARGPGRRSRGDDLQFPMGLSSIDP